MKKYSFNFLEWVKKYIKLPSKEEAKKILKTHSKTEILEAYKEVYNLFKTKKSFNLASIKNSLIIAAALFILLGNAAQAKLPTVENLEQQYQKYFDSLEDKHITQDRSYNKKLFLSAMSEIEDVYKKLRPNKDYREDVTQLKTVIDKFTEVKKNIENIEDKELIKAKTLAVHLQSDAYFGFLADSVNK